MLIDEEAFKIAAKQEIKIRILTEKPQRNSLLLGNIKALREYPSFKLRYIREHPQAKLTIIDQKEVAMALAPSKRVGPPYLVSNHPSFVQIAQQYFETMWNKAKE